MNIYIRTRGFSTDYRYIPDIPEQSSKESELRQYENLSDLQYPTCILECTRENGDFLFLSGITSGRKDYQKTPIRYDLLLILEKRDLKDSNPLVGIIQMWLEDVKSALKEVDTGERSFDLVKLRTESNLGKILDENLSEEYWEELFKLTLLKEYLVDLVDLLELTPDNHQFPDKRKELDTKLTEKRLEDLLNLLELTPDNHQLPDKGKELETKLTGKRKELETKLIGKRKELETKLTGKRKELETKLKDLTDNIFEQKHSENKSLTSSNNFERWWNGVDKDTNCNDWMILVKKLLEGKVEGKALLLNIATHRSLGSFSPQNQEIGILLVKEKSQSKSQKISESQKKN